MLDPRQAFDRLIWARASSQAVARRILRNRLYRYVSTSLSGIQEYMALTELASLAGRSDLDLVVLDTPPTSNALDFFTAPQRLSEALDGTLVRLMRRAYSGGRSGFDLLGRSTAALLGALSRFTGTELLSEMMEFIDALSDLFGSFEAEAKEIEQLLRSPKVALCLVTTSDRATMRESKELRARLAQLGMRIDAVLFNRCHHPVAPPAPQHLEAELAREIDALNEAWNAEAVREAEIIDATASSWHGFARIVQLPLLPEHGERLGLLDEMGEFLWY
jgi:anion-transporting  ArsA/GET3 family ATPase